MPDSHVWHILASPVYIPGTIAVNVTWMERGFHAGQTFTSIARYRSEIATFPTHLAFNASVGGDPHGRSS